VPDLVEEPLGRLWRLIEMRNANMSQLVADPSKTTGHAVAVGDRIEVLLDMASKLQTGEAMCVLQERNGKRLLAFANLCQRRRRGTGRTKMPKTAPQNRAAAAGTMPL
jgi:hypothetical protein